MGNKNRGWRYLGNQNQGWAIAFGAMALLACVCAASEGLWSSGIRMQGFWDFEPGNDFVVGPEIGYSNYHMGSHRLQIKAAYLTSRPEHLFRENIYKQDYFLLSPVWHFRRSRLFDPTVQLDLGYMRYDTEYAVFKDLDNDSWIASLQIGVNMNFSQANWGLFYHFGYNFITPESGLVLPGVFGVGIWRML